MKSKNPIRVTASQAEHVTEIRPLPLFGLSTGSGPHEPRDSAERE